MSAEFIKKNTNNLRLIFVIKGMALMLFAFHVYNKDQKLLLNHKVIYAEAEGFSPCVKSIIGPCYSPRIVFLVNGRKYKTKGDRIYQEQETIKPRKYRLIYRIGDPSYAREQKEKEINLWKFYTVSVFFSSLGFLFFMLGLLGEKPIKKTYANHFEKLRKKTKQKPS